MSMLDLIMVFPTGLSASFLKIIKGKLTPEVAEYIDENKLYHFTNNNAADKILESGYIRSGGILTSYGIPAAYMFAGIPEISNYVKNLGSPDINPLLHPENILCAVKLSPTKEQLTGLQVRFQDGVIVKEGGMVFRPDQAEKVSMVIDLIKDKNGNERLGLRELTKEEIEQAESLTDEFDIGGKTIHLPKKFKRGYKPSQECLEAIESAKKQLGYVKYLDFLSTAQHVFNAENKRSMHMIFSGITGFVKRLSRSKTNQIEEAPNAQIKRIVQGIAEGDIGSDRPELSKSYKNWIISLNKEGRYQKDFPSTMDEMMNSSYFQLSQRLEDHIDKSCIYKSKKHGINHSRRVAMLASEIMERVGINYDERDSELLLTACYYHDIGRIMDVGPHAKRSVSKLKKMDLKHLNGEEYTPEERNMLYAVVEAHEAKPDQKYEIMSKYNIPEDKIADCYLFMSVLRDADALDRARLSNKFTMDLKPEYLSIWESKSLINFSFDLNKLSELMPTEKIMKCETVGRPRENQFLDSIRVTTQDDNRTPTRNRSDIHELGQNINIPQTQTLEPNINTPSTRNSNNGPER